MNIVIVHQYAYAPSSPASTRHYELARELIELGHRVVIVAGGFDHKRRIETKSYGADGYFREVVAGVPFIWVKTFAYRKSGLRRVLGMLGFYRGCRKVLATGLTSTPDIILGSSPSLLAALAAMHGARRRTVPFVLEIRDIWPQTLADIGGMSKWHPLYLGFSIIERILYKRANAIVTSLPAAASHFEAVSGRKQRVFYIPNAARFPEEKISVGQENDSPERYKSDRFIVMYAGALGKSNDIDLIIRAAAKLKALRSAEGLPLEFVFYGQGEEKSRLVSLASDLGLTNIRFEGVVPKEQISKVLQRADCFVASVRNAEIYRYGISLNKLNDYFAAAKPVVIATNAANNPVADSGGGISVLPGDSAALADAIRRLASLDPDERRRIGEVGRRYAREHHDFSQLGRKLAEALESVITAKKLDKSGDP